MWQESKFSPTTISAVAQLIWDKSWIDFRFRETWALGALITILADSTLCKLILTALFVWSVTTPCILSTRMSSSAVIIKPSLWSLEACNSDAMKFSMLKSLSFGVNGTSCKSRILLKTEPIFTSPSLSIRPTLPIPIRLLTMKPPSPASHANWPDSRDERIWTLDPFSVHSSTLSLLAVTLPCSDTKDA